VRPRLLRGPVFFVVCSSATRHLLALSAESHTLDSPYQLAESRESRGRSAKKKFSFTLPILIW